MTPKRPPYKMTVLQYEQWWEEECRRKIAQQLTQLNARYGRHRVAAVLDELNDRHHVMSEHAE